MTILGTANPALSPMKIRSPRDRRSGNRKLPAKAVNAEKRSKEKAETAELEIPEDRNRGH